MLHDRLFSQVNGGWVWELRLLLLLQRLGLLTLRVAGYRGVATGGLLPISSDKTSEEP